MLHPLRRSKEGKVVKVKPSSLGDNWRMRMPPSQISPPRREYATAMYSMDVPGNRIGFRGSANTSSSWYLPVLEVPSKELMAFSMDCI